MRKLPLIITFLLCFYNASCSVGFSEAQQKDSEQSVKFTLCCWNAQTFFDSETDGTEYTDFKNLSKWSREKYIARLGKLCNVMTAINPDVMVLEEIENRAVVQDIVNQLAGNAWSKKNNWHYAAFAKNEGAAIGCAVFSRFPIDSVKVHNLDIRTQLKEQPQSRPIMQVGVEIDGRAVEVFVNHWKSKTGGQEETEIWRDWQEVVCQREISNLRLNSEKWACVLCGDFNRDIMDFIQSVAVDKNIIFRGTDGIETVNSTWLNSSGNLVSGNGSYFYKGEWERIDNIFTAGNISVSSFCVKKDGDWVEKDGMPYGYSIYSGEGYSDHLPLFAILSLN